MKLSHSLVIIGLLLFIATGAFADTIGIVDFRKVIDAYPETESVRQKINALTQSKQKEYSSAKAALEAEKEAIQNKFSTLSQEEAARVQQEFGAKYQALQDMGTRFDSEIKELSEKEYGALKDKVVAVMKKVAAKEKITVIMDVNAIYVGGIDLTDKVIAAFENPVGQ